MRPSNIELCGSLLRADHDPRFAVSLIFSTCWQTTSPINSAAVDTHVTITMEDQLQDTPGIRNAIKRLPSVLSRKASTATTTLKRSKSKTFDSFTNLPDKDAVPARSALRGGRGLGNPHRRVSFYDSLPCLDYGPEFNYQAPWLTELADRGGGLLLPAITAEDRSTDDRFRELEHNREQSAASPAGLQPVSRHDSSIEPVEPVSLRRTKSVRLSKPSGGPSGNAERRRSCMDFTKAMMEEHARSQSQKRPLSSLADRAARGQSPRPARHEPADVAFSQGAHPRKSSPGTQEQIPKADHLDKTSHAYKAHVDQSLRSMQGTDKRGSAFLHESLIEMHEALEQALAETTATRLSSTDEDEADRAYAQAKALHCRSVTDGSNASNDKTGDAFSFDMPYDSAQPSAEAVNSTRTTHPEASPRPRDLETYDRSGEDLVFDPALMPLPLRIRPRQPPRDSAVAE